MAFDGYQTRVFERQSSKGQSVSRSQPRAPEVLNYSERVIPIPNARKTSGPVALFEGIRQHASKMHDVLKRHWKCPDQVCQPHQPYLDLRAGPTSAHINVFFVVMGETGSSFQPMKEGVVIQPAKHNTAAERIRTPLSYVVQASSFTATQERHECINHSTKESSGFSKKFSKDLRNKPSSTPSWTPS